MLLFTDRLHDGQNNEDKWEWHRLEAEKYLHNIILGEPKRKRTLRMIKIYVDNIKVDRRKFTRSVQIA